MEQTKTTDFQFVLFDCETTGKPKDYGASYTDVDNWPRVTQLAWMRCDAAGNILSKYSTLIKPDGWTIPEEEFFINNNMTTARCEEFGQPIGMVLALLMSDLVQAQFLVAHNLSFDHRIVWAEKVRAGIAPNSGMTKICTMIKSTKHCKIPNVGRGGYKWPKLEEMYNVLFGEPMAEAHDAMADVIALKECFFELVRLNVIVPVLDEPKPAVV